MDMESDLLHLLLLLPLLAAVTYVTVKVRRRRKNGTDGPRFPPGPWRLPVIGSLHHLALSPLVVHRAMADLARRCDAPDVMYLRLGELPAVVASSPDAAREILRTHDAAFATHAMSLSVRASIRDKVGIFVSPYGKKWRQLRAICTLQLLSAKRVRSFRPIREEQVARVVAAIAAACTSPGGEPVNVSRQIAGPMSDLALRAIMGECFGRHREEFLDTLGEALRKTTALSAADLFPSWRLLRAVGSTVRDKKALNAKLFGLVDCAIEQHRERRAAGDDAHGDEECLLTTLLTIHKESDDDHDGPLTMATVKAVVLDMFSGGTETTATTLDWAMSELARNPEVMQKAQAEIRHALQGKSRVTEDDLINLKYPKNIIKETLRLHPVAPLLVPRECQESCKILGYDVPKGTITFVNAWAIGRDHRYWDDAEVFMPERFDEKTAVDFKGTNFEFIPFGAGRRMCPGLTFAQAAIELALTALLYHFDWHLPPGVTPGRMDMEEEFGVSVSRKRDLYLRPILRVGLELGSN